MTVLPARSSWPWRAFKRPSPRMAKAPALKPEPSGHPRARSSASLPVPCRHPIMPHPCASNIRGSARGNASPLNTCPRQRAPQSRATKLGGRTFGFALQTRARGPAAAVQRRRRAGGTEAGMRESKLGFPHRKTLAGGRPRTPFRPPLPDGEGRTVADLQVRASQARPRISAPRPLTRRRP